MRISILSAIAGLTLLLSGCATTGVGVGVGIHGSSGYGNYGPYRAGVMDTIHRDPRCRSGFSDRYGFCASEMDVWTMVHGYGVYRGAGTYGYPYYYGNPYYGPRPPRIRHTQPNPRPDNVKPPTVRPPQQQPGWRDIEGIRRANETPLRREQSPERTPPQEP